MNIREKLGEEEQKELFELYQTTKDKRIREKLILHNLGLVYWVVSKMSLNSLQEQEDLQQSGTIGLIKAIEGYKPGIAAFSTYAIQTIKRTIQRDLISYREVIRIPEHRHYEVLEMKKTQEKLQEKLGRDPTKKEIALKMNISIKELEDLEIISQDVRSLNTTIRGHDESLELQDSIEDKGLSPQEIVEDIIFIEEFKELAEKTLTREQYQAIILFYGLTNKYHSIAEIADIQNKTIGQVRHTRDTALRELRHTRYMKEIRAEVEDKTSYYKSIDYSKPNVSGGGYKTSPVEKIILEREKLEKELKKIYF